jgi:ribonuclease BN (tRNA processing enzyme)
MFSRIARSAIIRLWTATLVIGGLPLYAFAADSSRCPDTGVILQVLGSGGPIADDGRASSGYLLWVDGKSRYLIDAGGGVFLRFAEAGGDFSELDLIGISHFHADHSADLPALLKSGNFAKRQRELPISGPDGATPFPGLGDYLNSMFDSKNGAYGYLSGYLDGHGGLPKLRQIEVQRNAHKASVILDDAESRERVEAMHVPHGIVPALAYRVQIGDKSIVFSSDQNGSDERFIEFAKNADVLVMHMPVPEGVTGAGRKLHAPPSVIGEIAAKAEVNTLVLSHFMSRSLADLEQNVSIIRSGFTGPVLVASDLDCISVVD